MLAIKPNFAMKLNSEFPSSFYSENKVHWPITCKPTTGQDCRGGAWGAGAHWTAVRLPGGTWRHTRSFIAG